MTKRIFLTLTAIACALLSGAQTLTATYIALADSADHYIRAERWEDAERMIIGALRHEPANKSNYLLWANLGRVRTATGNLDGAIEAFDAGLASAPRSTSLLSGRAGALIAKGDAKSALYDLDVALEVDSTLQWPRKMRALTRLALGDSTGAEADISVYAASFEPDAAILEAEGDIAAGKGDNGAAREKYLQSYSLEPDPETLIKGAEAADAEGKLGECAELLADGIKQYPDCANLYLLRARLNKSRHLNSEMERDLKKAHELGAGKSR